MINRLADFQQIEWFAKEYDLFPILRHFEPLMVTNSPSQMRDMGWIIVADLLRNNPNAKQVCHRARHLPHLFKCGVTVDRSYERFQVHVRPIVGSAHRKKKSVWTQDLLQVLRDVLVAEMYGTVVAEWLILDGLTMGVT